MELSVTFKNDLLWALGEAFQNEQSLELGTSGEGWLLETETCLVLTNLKIEFSSSHSLKPDCTEYQTENLISLCKSLSLRKLAFLCEKPVWQSVICLMQNQVPDAAIFPNQHDQDTRRGSTEKNRFCELQRVNTIQSLQSLQLPSGLGISQWEDKRILLIFWQQYSSAVRAGVMFWCVLDANTDGVDEKPGDDDDVLWSL